MKSLKYVFPGFVLAATFFLFCTGEQAAPKLTISVPIVGNSWLVNGDKIEDQILNHRGMKNWTDPGQKIGTYFYVEETGELDIGIRARVNSGKSKLRFTFGKTTKNMSLSNTEFDTISIGTFKIDQPGYQQLIMQGVEKDDSTFCEVTDILTGGKATKGKVHFVKDDFYWGRRGPSVHLSYELPQDDMNVLWFYNEITVPEGNDVIGSYFMANGFAEGYFGIQVNSATERRILFSVWSPFKTDDPTKIPDDQKIRPLKKGENVNTGKFGNEGSGGQSYRKYYWQAGTKYRFLLKGQPAGANSTDYTAYFYAPETGKWELIASFRRPKTNTYLKRPHSFLENFMTETGYLDRMGFYSNQWVCDTNGNWHELTKAKFTADATARKDARLDYSGGAENDIFFLKNCGFTNDHSTIGTFYTRKAGGEKPQIDFSKLP
jgi:hypothetical protein